ncbi:MAG: proline--tRNA ligase [Christensenellaceae bacterium]|nr:proline--tRNA ligase [Christensenellaceae bacterium]
MAKQKNEKEFVAEITRREDDISQWYTDVILKTDLVDYAPVRGCMVIKPYGYGIWELMQSEMDARFKATGHQNVYMPMFIPESLLLKEAEHVEGFAPEVAWVTQGGSEELPERLAIRPTSETMFCAMYSKWVQSWRDLPMLYNQWCSVVRWEKSTRPFLRTSEFLWQEGHTIHATPGEAEEETLKMLEVYRDFSENVLAIPVFVGKKSEKEKFAGARATYSMEAMMQDGKALQAGTSHNFGDNFSKVFDIQFLDKDGTRKYVSETSWGTSTRMIGGVIMVHGDDRGLVLPPKVAPVQVVILPIAQHKEGVLDACYALKARLAARGLRVHVDDRDTQSAGWKFNEWEMKGVPLRVEIGPRDLETGQALLMRRDTMEKFGLKLEGLENEVEGILQSIHDGLYQKALAFREGHVTLAANMEELHAGVQNGFVKAMWCGERACEDAVKQESSATTRNMPFDQEAAREGLGERCVCCGKPAQKVIYFAKAY